MKFSIVFDNSGDSLVFDALSSETYAVLEYYVDQLESNNTNKFTAQQFQAQQAIDEFDSCLREVNKVIAPVTEQEIPVGDVEYYLNQQVLNKIHASWVQSQGIDYVIAEKQQSNNSAVRDIADQIHEMISDDLPKVKIGNVLDKLNLSNAYSKVNLDLHFLEQQFNKIKFKTDNWVEFENPFSKSLLSNSVCNFSLAFSHLGRTLYNKWKNFDTDLEFNDENSYNQLLGFVDIKLQRPETIQLCPEYVDWCYKHGKVPSGDFLNIGNILDLDKKLNECRIVLYRNIHSGNSFSITLNKG